MLYYRIKPKKYNKKYNLKLYNVNDLIIFNIKNLKLKHLNKKLIFKFVKPFKINSKIKI